MKKLIILSLILAAGLTAYPQSSRSSREAKSSKSKSSQVSNRSSSRSNSSKAVKSSNSQNRSKATKARSSSSKSAVNRSSSSRSSAPKAVSSRSSSNRSKSSSVKSGNRSGNSSAVKSGSNSSRSSRSSSSAARSSQPQSNNKAVKSSSSSSRTSRSAVGNSSANRNNQSASRSSSSRTSRSDAKKSNNVLQSTNSRSSVPNKIKDSDRGRSQASSAVKSRNNGRSDQATRASTSSSFNRSNRQGNKTYERNDGAKFRHQNDEVFTRHKYRVDYRDVNDLRRSRDFVRVRNHYHNWYSHRHVRRVVVHNHFYRPLALDVRMHRYPYRRPVHLDLCWTPHLHHSFVYYYPMHSNWNIHYGDYIETASSYEAMNYVGTVKRVYGKVEEVYYSPEDRTYTLYYGAPYPYHDFSVVVPRAVAKSFSWSPSWYFEDEHVWVVGLIETWEGKPEIVIHDEQQIRRY